jgi:hypothetical protein
MSSRLAASRYALGLLVLLTLAGCRTPSWLRRNSPDVPPVAFTALPSPAEAVAAVNANTQRVQSLQSQGATLSIPGAPTITADLAVERPRRLRLKARTQLTGPELDLGSNDELFWLWAARMPDPSVFYARHDQFATSRARQMLAVEPSWLVEALGLVEIDPATVVEGPFLAGGDRIQLKTTVPDAAEPYTRLMILHHRYGWVLEQHLYDSRGQLIASARTSGHEYHPIDGVSLPKRIEVQVPQGILRLQLDVDRWSINQALVEGAATFSLPRDQLSNRPFVDMADPSFVPPAAMAQPQPVATPRLSSQPLAPTRKLRGFTAWR